MGHSFVRTYLESICALCSWQYTDLTAGTLAGLLTLLPSFMMVCVHASGLLACLLLRPAFALAAGLDLQHVS